MQQQPRRWAKASLALAFCYLILLLPMLLHRHSRPAAGGSRLTILPALCAQTTLTVPLAGSDECALCDLLNKGMLAVPFLLAFLPRWQPLVRRLVPALPPPSRSRPRHTPPRAPPAFS